MADDSPRYINQGRDAMHTELDLRSTDQCIAFQDDILTEFERHFTSCSLRLSAYRCPGWIHFRRVNKLESNGLQLSRYDQDSCRIVIRHTNLSTGVETIFEDIISFREPNFLQRLVRLVNSRLLNDVMEVDGSANTQMGSKLMWNTLDRVATVLHSMKP